jgi:hypothetical protein
VNRSVQERGFALAAALLALAVAAGIGAATSELGRLHAVLARQRKATAAALAALDGCVERAVATLPAGWAFDDVLAGADGLGGTADDGVVPLPGPCLGTARAAPGPPAPPRIVLEVEAETRGGRRRLDAVLARRPDPGVPALVWIADPGAIGRVPGRLVLDGVDPAALLAPQSLLAAPAPPDALDAWVTSQGAAVVAGGGSTPPLWAPPPPLADLVVRAGLAGAGPPGAGLLPAPPVPPALMLSAGDLVLAAPSAGAGLLIVDGVLRIEASLTFAGVIAARGGLQVGPAGVLEVAGAVWLGDGGLGALVVDGEARVTASAAAVAAADALLPLPRRVRLAAVQDF